MQKYCFEMYEDKERGIRFLGYKVVVAEDTEQALLSAQEVVSGDIRLVPIHI